MKFRKIIALLLTVSLIIPLQFADSDKAIAASPTVQICRGSSDEVLSYQSVVIGKSYTDIKCVVKNGTAKTITWSGQGKNVIEVKGKGNAAEVKGINEGFEKLKVEVVTTGGETIRDDAIFSVYALAESTMDAQTKIATKIYWGVSTDTNVRSELKKGQKLQIIGYSKAFYRVKMPDDFTFANRNDQRWGYILKRDISIPVEKISLDKTEITLKQGERTELNASIIPSEADEKNVAWKSSAADVVSVSKAGLLTAKKSGTAEIEASAGGKKVICKVTVSDESIGEVLKLSSQKETLEIGESSRIYIANGAVKAYSSENDNIAEVSSEGIVEAVAPGQTDIVVTGSYGEKVSCKITVKYPNTPTVKVIESKKQKNKYVISWSEISGVTGYQIYKYKSAKAGYKFYKKVKASEKRSATVTKGRYKVRSYKKNKKGKVYYSAFTIAKFNKKTETKYKIIFAANGGMGKSYSQIVDFNKKTRLKANQFKREGYAFVGWAKTKTGQVVQKNRSRAKNLTDEPSIKLYAKWRSDNDPNGKVQRRALLYADSKDGELGNCMRQDAALMKKVLDGAKFETAIISSVIESLSVSQYENKIEEVGRNTTANDVTYLYFSCHGKKYAALKLKSGELLFAEELRKQLDDYVAGKVVLLLDFCYSGIYLKEHIGIDKVFVKEFVEAGTGVKALSKNGKYKIMTSSDQNISVGGEVVSAATGYWAKGMGFTEHGTQSILYADAMSEDEFGNQCFGNNDGEVTLEELYKYASPMIYEELYFRRAGENNYPQRYPENDNFVIYKR